MNCHLHVHASYFCSLLYNASTQNSGMILYFVHGITIRLVSKPCSLLFNVDAKIYTIRENVYE